MQIVSGSNRTLLAYAAGGPLVLGAAVGMPLGLSGVMGQALHMTGLVLGLTTLMAPALYIALSLTGPAPDASQVARAFGQGLRSSGIIFAGLAPAVAFLLATSSSPELLVFVGALVLAAGAVVGLRMLLQSLRQTKSWSARSLAVFVAWAIVLAGLGLDWFYSVTVKEVL